MTLTPSILAGSVNPMPDNMDSTVETHVLRLAKRIGMTQKTDPVKVEFDLMEILPEDQWARFSNLLILHGRAICTARNPRHEKCKIVDLCEEGIRWKKGKA